jgi:signal transduction histidine kinase
MASPAMDPDSSITDRRARPRIPWHVVYYLLAAFNVLTVSASLYLSARLFDIYTRSVSENQEWAQHLDEYASLQRLAADVNAPGNDVFESRDVARESERVARARAAFAGELALLRRHLTEVHPQEARPMLARFQAVDRAMEDMIAEARTTFAAFAAGGAGPAGSRMAAMDRRYAAVLSSLLDLRRDVRKVQQRLFDEQTTAAQKLQRYEALIAALIVLMVGGAILYGWTISKEMGRETVARERYRMDLEQQMESRTQALRDSKAALTQAASEWRRTFDAIDSPVMILDLEDRLVRANATVRALTGKGASTGVTGRLVTSLGDCEPWATAGRVAVATRVARSARSAEAHDGATGRSWDVSAYLMESVEGGDGRIIVVAKDTTRLLELRETLRREENMTAMGALVAGVAHEVRNPIFAISSTLDAFEARFGNAPEREKYFSVLRREVERLGALMRDLLDYGRPPQMETAAVALRDVVAEAIRSCCEIVEKPADVTVVNDVTAALPAVVVDPRRMAQAFLNVIHNAVLHTPAGGEVVVKASPRVVDGRRWIESSVRDTGPGFRPEDLPHVFRPLFTKRPGGTGLGLPIAQRIVEKHGGVMHAGNAPQGGALVTIRLPLDPTARPDVAEGAGHG